MTSPSETIAKAMEGVTPPDKLHVVFSTWKEDGSINIRRWSTFMEFDGSTAYIAEPSVNAVTKERDALALQLEAMQREIADIRKSVRNAMGAIESNQVADKDVHGTLSRVINRLDALSGARTLIQGEKK